MTEENESHAIKFRLRDYSIHLTGHELSVDGPDDDISNMIGKRFLEFIKNKKFQKLLTIFLESEDTVLADRAEKKLIELLHIPSKTDTDIKIKITSPNLVDDRTSRKYKDSGIKTHQPDKPKVIFKNRVFCFTGKSAHFTRKELFEKVLERGGRVSKYMNSKVNYLILGEEGSPCFRLSAIGNKIEEAEQMLREEQGNIIAIYPEQIFIEALEENQNEG